MQLSDETLEVLANFARINPNLLIKPGNEFTTLTTNRSIFGTATVLEYFEAEMAIHDLPTLLQYIKLVGDSPDIEVDDSGENLIISGNGTTVNYTLSDKVLLECEENRPSIKEDPFAVLNIHEDVLNTILTSKSIGKNKADTVEFSYDGNQLLVSVYNEANSSSNVVVKELVGDVNGVGEFSIKFMDTQFPFIIQDYSLNLYERKMGDMSVFFGKYESELVDYVTTAKANAGCYVAS